jgi:hypothetical protein
MSMGHPLPDFGPSWHVAPQTVQPVVRLNRDTRARDDARGFDSVLDIIGEFRSAPPNTETIVRSSTDRAE